MGIGVNVSWVVITQNTPTKNINKMKHIKSLLLIAMAISVFTSCRKVVGEGPVITQERITGPYEGLEIHIPANVDYTEAEEYKITIEGQSNIINHIETGVSDNRLKIKFNKDNIFTFSAIKIHISAPQINSLVLSGSGSLNILTSFHPVNLNIVVSGSGSINMNKIITNDIEATVSGSGNIKSVSGTANNEKLTISGSGTINLLEVKAISASTQSSGSGTMKVQPSTSLDAKISGSGNVYYKGNPIVTTTISGSGNVIKL